ncbi:MAG: PKD domain-containing protein, partial [Cryomorphaceae bacterium]
YTNLQFPPELVFENNGQTDTVYVSVTAYNQCGSDADSLSFILIPPNVYLEMPDYANGICPGETIEIPTEIVEGDPFDGCTVTSTPPIPGISASCDADLDYISVTIPESTPAGEYTLETTISGCGTSTDFTQIEVFPTPEIDFEIPETACTSEEIPFENLTGGAVSFEWDFGDPESPDNESTLSMPTHSYNTPGIYTVTLQAVSDSGCTAEVQKNIEIFGPDPSITIDNNAVCSGEPFYAEFQSQDDLMSLEWEFLLPGKDTLIYTVEAGIENTFFNNTENVEIWNITLTLQDIYGCESHADAEAFILPQPSAFFTHSELIGCGQGEEIQFTNQSTVGTSSKWSFDDPGSGPENLSFTRNPTHSFTSPGDYDVNLFVQNSFGCQDDFSRRLSCLDVIVYVPNAFTPDGNRINEIFKPVIYGINDIEFTVPDYYTFSVFNRWGDMVYTTNDPDEGWNGDSPDLEYYAQSEVYIWRVSIEFPDGSKEWDGHVTLVR